MKEQEIFADIKRQIEASPRKEKMVTIHKMMFIHAKDFEHLSAREFCERLNLPESFKTEFSKMRNLSAALDDKLILDRKPLAVSPRIRQKPKLRSVFWCD